VLAPIVTPAYLHVICHGVGQLMHAHMRHDRAGTEAILNGLVPLYPVTGSAGVSVSGTDRPV
jgi:hypothetical protein